MNLTIAAKILFATYLNLKLASGKETIIEAAYPKNGFKNQIYFASSFELEDGTSCDKCALCDGTILRDFFIHRDPSNCIECSSDAKSCDSFSITTSFQHPWKMRFNILRSSNKDKKYDPKQVIIRGTNDHKVWEDLFVSEATSEIFESRNEEKEFVLSIDKEYKAYKITFKIKDSLKIHVGSYDVIKAYTRQCSADHFNTITQSSLQPYETSAPTEVPTTSPTSIPTTAAPTNVALNNDSIRTAVSLWFNNKSKAITQYGHISDWNTSYVTDMSHLLNVDWVKNEGGGKQQGVREFNDDLSNWDVAGVTTMLYMFNECNQFNSDISGWNTAKVTIMSRMFGNNYQFNANLSKWNVGRATNISYMFQYCYVFNGDISTWNLGSVTSMNAMFGNAKSFNIDIGGWRFPGAKSLAYQFHEAHKFNQDLSTWEVDHITDTSATFHGALSFNQDISGWKVDNVTLMNKMFEGAESFNVNVSVWNVANVTNMITMFKGAKKFNQKLCWSVSGKKINEMFTGSSGKFC